jgi:hypothetical protein
MSDDLREKREAEFGYREISSRELGLREWMFKRENAGFDALVNRLRVRKWADSIRAEGGERLEKLRAKKRRWAADTRAQDVESARRADRAKRRGAYKKAPLLLACVECGATWCKAPWVRGVQPRFCGTACYQRARYRVNEIAREQKKASERSRYARRAA